MMSRLITTLCLALMLLMAFWLRIDNLTESPPGISNDEAIYLIDTFNVARGGKFTWFEHGRPEPGFQLILSTTTRFFGGDPFVVRLTPILLSLLTIATVYWATLQVLYDRPSSHQYFGGLIASGALMTSLGFITLSRAIERGVPQILFMALFIGAFARFQHTKQRRDAIFAGIALSGTIYFYTAGLVLPAVLAPVGLWFVLFYANTWREWLLPLMLMGMMVAILTAPWSITLLTNSGLILDRAGEVRGAGLTLERAISLTWEHLLIAGDPNPQYNTASQPMILLFFQPFFILGLGALLARIKQPTTIAIITFLVLGALPPLLTNEPIHGIRAIGMFGAFPFIIGLGAILTLWLIERFLSPQYRLVWLILGIGFLGINTRYANQIYAEYWLNPPLTRVYVDALTVGEWYFRQDRRDVARWLMRQNQPVLMPIDELNLPTIRAWTINHIPNLQTADDAFSLPTNTRLFLPWQIETDDLRRDTRLYALVDGDTISLLPPLSVESHRQLLSIAENGERLTRGRGNYLNFMGYNTVLSDDFILQFDTNHQTSQTPLANFADGAVYIDEWRGAETIQGVAGEILTYFLRWHGDELDQRYFTVLQLHTQDADSKASAADISLAYLYPNMIWDENISPFMEYRLILTENLPFGAYRLVAGIYDAKTRTHLNATSLWGHPLDTLATIGWIKVPHPPMTMPENAIPINAILGEQIGLNGLTIQNTQDDQIALNLYWQAVAHRPDMDATLFIQVFSGDRRIGQTDTRPMNGQYPTMIWDMGETVMTEHVLSLDSPIDENTYLLIGMYTFPTLERLSVMIDGVPQPDNVIRLDIGR
ncbi:MAG: hypothetical protein CUN52_01550 [Phototrophicales bacterium]|nr:MAG: hypothetical protein CUN52_01550 [Phototrophicales bacterium]